MLGSTCSLLTRIPVGAFLDSMQVSAGSVELQSRAGTGYYHFSPLNFPAQKKKWNKHDQYTDVLQLSKIYHFLALVAFSILPDYYFILANS